MLLRSAIPIAMLVVLVLRIAGVLYRLLPTRDASHLAGQYLAFANLMDVFVFIDLVSPACAVISIGSAYASMYRWPAIGLYWISSLLVLAIANLPCLLAGLIAAF